MGIYKTILIINRSTDKKDRIRSRIKEPGCIIGSDGFSLIELLIGMTILTLAMLSLIPLFGMTTQMQVTNEDKVTAVNLANRELERARTLAYENVGTINGNPNGSLTADRDETYNGKSYRIEDRVRWVLPTESSSMLGFKEVTVRVLRTGSSKVLASVSTTRTRESGEPVSTKGYIKVAAELPNGTPLEDVMAQITAGPSSPYINWTNENGSVLFAELTPSQQTNDYTVRVSKTGYIVRGQDTQQVTVSSGQLRTVSFVLGGACSVRVNLVNEQAQPITASSTLTLDNPDAGSSQYSSSDGKFSVNSLFPGIYDITAQATAYRTETRTGFVLNSGDDKEITITMTSVPMGSLHIEAYNSVTRNPLDSAAIRLENNSSHEITSGQTAANGIFDTSLGQGTYNVQISKQTYQTYQNNITITASQENRLSAYLQPIPQVGSILVRAQRSYGGTPRDDVQIRVVGQGEDITKYTGTYAPGEALFDNLQPGGYTVYRKSYYSWTDSRNVTVAIQAQVSVTYVY